MRVPYDDPRGNVFGTFNRSAAAGGHVAVARINGSVLVSAPCSITPPVCGEPLHRWRGQPATGSLLSEYLRSHAGSVIKANLITAETLSMFSSSHQNTMQCLPELGPSSPGARPFSSVLGPNGAFRLFSFFPVTFEKI